MNIPGYRIERELGHGGMSTVYLAEQESLGRKVALKVMAPALAADRNFGERFLREARTVAQLSHPNILAIYDIGVASHSYYMAMEYVPGGDLKQRIRQGALEPEQALGILKQIAAALGYAHEKGFVHRDVKPENILFREDWTAVLTDFGIAKAVGSGTKMTGTGMTIGTAHYMSPEQARGRTVDGRSDLYSLGVVLYEMLVGRVPYDAEDTYAVSLMHISEPVPELSQQLAAFQPVLNQLLSKDPERRFAGAGELIAAVESLQAGQPLKFSAARTQVFSSVGKSHGSAGNRAFLWAACGGVLALLLFAGLMLIQQKSKPSFEANASIADQGSREPLAKPAGDSESLKSLEEVNRVTEPLQDAGGATEVGAPEDSEHQGVVSLTAVINEWLGCYSTGDIDSICALYAPEVDFFESGLVNRIFIRQEGERYFARWPIRHGTVRGEPLIRIFDSGAAAEVEFDWRFSVTRPGSRIQGVSRTSMMMRQFDGEWLIVRIREKVLERQKSG